MPWKGRRYEWLIQMWPKVVLDCGGYPPEHKEEISGPDDHSLARKLAPRRGILPSHIRSNCNNQNN